MPKRAFWMWVLCLGLAMTSIAGAKPTRAQWHAAEAVMRAHFAAQKKDLVEVTHAPLETLGTSFWVRYAAGGGGIAIVRNKEVFTEPGPATISAVLRCDQIHKTRSISANDFLYLLEMLNHLPKLDGSPLRGDKMKELNPSWTYEKDRAVFTFYASRSAEDTGDSLTPTRPVTRAQLVVRADYSLAAWVIEDIDHAIKKK